MSQSDDLDVEVTPPYLTESYSLYRTLRAATFPRSSCRARTASRTAACVRARPGSAFATTAIVVECREPALRAFRPTEASSCQRAAGRATAERLSIELADAVLCDDAELLSGSSRRLDIAAADSIRLTSFGRFRTGQSPVSIERPLISVVVPYRDRTRYLPDCLEGLARQTYRALEVVIADDGSTSADALERLRDLQSRSWPWPLRVVHLEHGGLGPARNGGWRSAVGELVTFIDDDDVAFDHLVETLWRARVISGADVAVGGARFFHGDGAPSAHTGDVVRISLCEPRELGLISNQYGGPVNLWPRSLLERLGGFHAQVEDWDLLARATFAGARLVTPPDPVYWYRQTPDSMYSADPAAFRDAGVPSHLGALRRSTPSRGLKLVPQLAAGAYSELERRRTARARARSAWRRAPARAPHRAGLVRRRSDGVAHAALRVSVRSLR